VLNGECFHTYICYSLLLFLRKQAVTRSNELKKAIKKLMKYVVNKMVPKHIFQQIAQKRPVHDLEPTPTTFDNATTAILEVITTTPLKATQPPINQQIEATYFKPISK